MANLSQRALNDPEIVAATGPSTVWTSPILSQYFLYMWNLLRFDLGTSIRTNNPVLDELLRCYPATIELALLAIIIAAVLGILFGVISAIRRNSVLDQGVRAVFRHGREHSELLVRASDAVFLFITSCIFSRDREGSAIPFRRPPQ